MSTAAGQHVPAIPNKEYKKNGMASYVWLLQKYNITPTKPGPYFRHHTEPNDKREMLEYPGLRSLRKHKHRHHHDDQPADADAEATGETVSADPEEPASAQHVLSLASMKGGSQVTAIDQQNDSMYLCPVEIGGQKVLLDFDTGSADLWVMSTHLDDATEQSLHGAGHNIYDPDASLDMRQVGGASWQIQYGDGSSASGDVVTDTLQLGTSCINNQGIECAKQLSPAFQQSKGDGLLGLAMGSINTVQPTQVRTPIENLASQDPTNKQASLFTCWLSSWRDDDEDDKGQSFYTFGYIDQPSLRRCNNATDFHWTPLVNQSTRGFWEFPSTTYTINNRSFKRKSYQKGGNTAIADTGTTLALVDDSVCQAIYSVIPKAYYDSQNQGWVFPTKTPEKSLPSVKFDVGGASFEVPKESLLFAETMPGMCYGGIQSRGDLPFDILGDTWLKGVYCCFDQGGKRFGAAQRTLRSQNLSAPSV